MVATPLPRSFSRTRLPQPSTRTRARKEIVLRPATPDDAPACALVDSAYTTTHIWQLDTRQDGDELRVCFRQVRLPRELSLIAPHRPPALPSGTQRKGLLWLVAEEIEVGGDSAVPPERSRPATTHPAWTHAMRRSATAATVQLGLPQGQGQSDAASLRAPAPEGPRAGKSAKPAVVGYVAVAAAPRDESAYLRALVVDRAHRRKGIASRLLAEAKRWAARQGAGRLIADVQARNYPALRLLQKGGFTFCGFNDCCYADGEVAVFFSARLR
jgi:GNAT superfamily N-acetyltransferase